MVVVVVGVVVVQGTECGALIVLQVRCMSSVDLSLVRSRSQAFFVKVDVGSRSTLPDASCPRIPFGGYNQIAALCMLTHMVAGLH